MPMPRKKRPYTPPTIRTEQLYERKSLACGKVQPPFGQPPERRCIGRFKNS